MGTIKAQSSTNEPLRAKLLGISRRFLEYPLKSQKYGFLRRLDFTFLAILAKNGPLQKTALFWFLKKGPFLGFLELKCKKSTSPYLHVQVT